MPDQINPEEKWEFGSLEWCTFAAETGVRLLKESNLDLIKYNWGFTEEYTFTPKRLLGGRKKAGYQFFIKDGKVNGGPVLTAACLVLPGFHVVIEWALIAHASAVQYDNAGSAQRDIDAAVLNAELEAAGYIPKTLTGQSVTKPVIGQKSRCFACGSNGHERQRCPIWPPGIREALSFNKAQGGGLHNIGAKHLRRSPELDDLPETSYCVPIFSRMTDEQKKRFVNLLGR